MVRERPGRVKLPDPWPLKCRATGCGNTLGETDGQRLYLGTCWFTRQVTLHCRRCGQRNNWTPYQGAVASGERRR